MLLILLVVLALLFFGAGFGTHSHPRYGGYSNSGYGLGTVLLLVVIALFFTGNLHL